MNQTVQTLKNPGQYLKAIVAVVGAVLTSVLANFPDNNAIQIYGSIIAAALTAVSVYLVPNASIPATHDPEDESTVTSDKIDAGTITGDNPNTDADHI